MPRFSANIATMFGEQPMLKRMDAAARAGFRCVEMQFVESFAVADLAAAKEAAGVEFSVFNIPAGDLTEGGPGLAAMPDRRDVFAAAVDVAVRYAAALRPRSVNILAGAPPADLDPAECRAALVENIRLAGDAMAGIGVGVVVEAINTRDRPGYFLPTSAAAMEVIDAAEHDNVGLEYDLYHMQIMEGDLAATLARLAPRIGHIQFADTPGRHEPGTGEIDFLAIFQAIDALDYDGWAAAEYFPSGKTEDSLEWLQPYLG